MSSRVLDLDHLTPAALSTLGLSELESIVAAVARLREHQQIDPELRATVLRRIGEALAAARISPPQAEAIRAELDEIAPIAVLTGHFKELTPPEVLRRPALGYYRRAFPRRERAVAPAPSEWIAEDPERLRGVVFEAARFCRDWRRVAETATQVADAAGIKAEIADAIIADAIRQLREDDNAG